MRTAGFTKSSLQMSYSEMQFPHRAGRRRPGPFLSRLIEVVHVFKDFDPRDGPLSTSASRAPAYQPPVSGVGVFTPYAAFSTRGITVCVLVFSELYIYVWKQLYFGDQTLSPSGTTEPGRYRSQSTFSQWSWGFHTVCGDIDPGDHCSCPQFARVVKV